MKKPLYILSIILLIYSCKKEDSVTTQEGINYTSYSPSIIFSSVDSIQFSTFGGSCPVPYPTDSLFEYELDINKDGANDFKISIQHWYSLVSSIDTCKNYNYTIYVSGLDADRQMATDGIYNIANIYESNEEIGGQGKPVSWNRNSTIMLKVYGAPFTTDFSGDAYLGFKVKSSESYNYGWIHIIKSNLTIEVIDCAINSKEGKSIRAGQKE